MDLEARRNPKETVEKLMTKDPAPTRKAEFP